MADSVIGSLAACASITKVSCGKDCIVAVGLCGRLRAWCRPAPHVRLSLTVGPGGTVSAAMASDAGGADEPWIVALSESSMYELANNRQSSHPYAHLSAISAAGRFVAATLEQTSVMHVYDTATWKRVQTIEPVEDEGEREEWMKRGVKSVRSTLSCLELAHGHLACGSREGVVRVWKASGGKAMLSRRHGNLRADAGPVASVVLAPTLLVAAYRQASGFTDGSDFSGEASAVGWSLSDGAMLWKVKGVPAGSPRATPVLGAVGCAERLVLLHADDADADAEWNLVRAPAAASKAAVEAARGSRLLRTLPLGGAAEGGGGASSSSSATASTTAPLEHKDLLELPRGAAAPGGGRLLSWHSDGDVLALGFAGGAVAVALQAAFVAGSPYVLASGLSASLADVGAVHVAPVAWLGVCDGKMAEDVFAATMLAADAAGCVRAWAMRLDSIVASAAAGVATGAPVPITLVALFELRLGVPSGSPPRQPSALGLIGTTIICGCADGTLHAKAAPAILLGGPNGAATAEPAAPSSAARAHTEYEWLFDTGAGPQARGKLAEKRRFFDGWARTAAYEVGLQAVLAKMAGQSGHTQPKGPLKPGAAAAAATSSGGGGGVGGQPSALRKGVRVRLSGLAARPELNGAVGELTGDLEAESGRCAVKLLAPAEHAGKGLKVKPANLTRIA